jgi:ElaB/YqjD/DUF883 family membrane-anchored ribosome-binding protein
MRSTFKIAGNGTDSASERIAGSMHRTLDRVAATAGGVEHDLRQRIAALRTEAREQEQRARAKLAANIDKTLTYARQKPLAAMGIALVAGAAIYGLFVRR